MASIVRRVTVLLEAAEQAVTVAEGVSPPFRMPPSREDLEYLQKLIGSIRLGRALTPTYNLVLLGLLLILTARHWREQRRDQRRWRARCITPAGEAKSPAVSSKVYEARNRQDTQLGSNSDSENESQATSSSSSSTLQGLATPPHAAKDAESAYVDLERLPLLGHRASINRNAISPGVLERSKRACAGWLARQPQPIPVIRRTLPSNATTLFVLGWFGVNVFYQMYGVPMGGKYLFDVADRASLIFMANLPLLYILAAKNQPIKLLTGRSYESLNIFHRRVGELMCFEALVHVAGLFTWRCAYAPEWLMEGSLDEFLLHRIVVVGLGAFFAYELLYLTSLGSFRQRWYELFLASHVSLQIIALVFAWLHHHTARPYVGIALAIFVIDRVIWRFRLKTVRMTADLDILEDGETLMLSADWDLPVIDPEKKDGSKSRTIISGWRPTDHIFLTVPALGRTHSLQAHPFTIASAAPPIAAWTGCGTGAAQPSHAWLNLLVRAQAGFTADLLAHARLHRRIEVRLDGPYGSRHALDLARASDTVIFVAGGSGIAVVFPLAAALLLQDAPRVAAGKKGQKVYLLWVTHSRAHRRWLPEERLDELADAGLRLVIPEPTAEAGRPDIRGLVDGWIADGAGRDDEVGVVVSGPDGMNRTVRNTCAAALGRGANLRVAVEKFGW
ncbi:uncharacterized protein E0L32_008642 [Thyridium curvatum]|uniref:FAD-binding FR-type domain-containing protein n=1 Tax=Thyridium curvatum TaxID=1093900 RepID=A0A507ARI9_9PEZI|nr:uncharacterized protein E0L32_008642 [Thyridium curvatum]TPX10423.1 hypothetical protein E0L32_008642 [Thyridium curvatum]